MILSRASEASDRTSKHGAVQDFELCRILGSICIDEIGVGLVG